MFRELTFYFIRCAKSKTVWKRGNLLDYLDS